MGRLPPLASAPFAVEVALSAAIITLAAPLVALVAPRFEETDGNHPLGKGLPLHTSKEFGQLLPVGRLLVQVEEGPGRGAKPALQRKSGRPAAGEDLRPLGRSVLAGTPCLEAMTYFQLQPAVPGKPRSGQEDASVGHRETWLPSKASQSPPREQCLTAVARL